MSIEETRNKIADIQAAHIARLTQAQLDAIKRTIETLGWHTVVALGHHMLATIDDQLAGIAFANDDERAFVRGALATAAVTAAATDSALD